MLFLLALEKSDVTCFEGFGAMIDLANGAIRRSGGQGLFHVYQGILLPTKCAAFVSSRISTPNIERQEQKFQCPSDQF
jgi:hypothetical protein